MKFADLPVGELFVYNNQKPTFGSWWPLWIRSVYRKSGLESADLVTKSTSKTQPRSIDDVLPVKIDSSGHIQIL